MKNQVPNPDIYNNQNFNSYMIKLYVYMSLGLVVSGLAAILCDNYSDLQKIIYIIEGGDIVSLSPAGCIVAAMPAVLSLYFVFGIPKIDPLIAHFLFWIYSASMGISLYSLFLIYTSRNTVREFFVTAALFIAMALYGQFSDRSLASFRSFLIMFIMGAIMSYLTNIALEGSSVHYLFSFLSIAFFTILAWSDIRRVKAAYLKNQDQARDEDSLPIAGALTLYLDYINIFVHLGRFFDREAYEKSDRRRGDKEL